MSPKILDFKCALITGGGGGLGYSMADHFVSQGKKVIVVGRTESKLKDAAEKLGHSATGFAHPTPYYVLDTGDVSTIPSFVKDVIKDHPDVDCLINNAGVQRPLDVNNFDLEKADQEIDINIRGPMHLTIGFLPHFKSKPAAVIMNVSSLLGYIPISVINPVYNGTKAFVHFWTMNLRTQLKDTNIRVIEIAPPTVGTELHREREDPDDNKKGKNDSALSVEEFMEDLTTGWQRDNEVIGAGMAINVTRRWYDEFGPDYAKVAGTK